MYPRNLRQFHGCIAKATLEAKVTGGARSALTLACSLSYSISIDDDLLNKLNLAGPLVDGRLYCEPAGLWVLAGSPVCVIDESIAEEALLVREIGMRSQLKCFRGEALSAHEMNLRRASISLSASSGRPFWIAKALN